LVLVERAGVLIALAFAHHWQASEKHLKRHYPGTQVEIGSCENAEQLRDFLQGELASLDRVQWAVRGTPFQEAVWKALFEIAPGETLSYLSLATRIGRPRAVRAVANAVGANPIAIVLPCHRVIGSDGSLTGFGGGLDKKRWLLRHEGVDV
jgi:methylated-DNA-[protein]-cysteine S-methyltransferase